MFFFIISMKLNLERMNVNEEVWFYLFSIEELYLSIFTRGF